MTVLLAATYDGTDLDQDAGGQARMRIRLLTGYYKPWEPRGGDTVVPTAEGQRPRNRKRNRLPIELYGPVMGCGATETLARIDLHDALQELKALFDPAADPATLTIQLPTGGTASISARPLPMVLGDDTIPTYREVTIPLEAVEDDWAEGQLTVAELVLEARDGNDPLGTPLGVLTEATDVEVLVEDNGVGSGQFSIDLLHAQAAWCQRGAYIGVYRDTATGDLDDAIAAFWIETEAQVLLSPDEQAGTTATVGGRGSIAYLAESVVWHRARAGGSAVVQPRRRRWFWKRAHPGRVLRRMLAEGRARGTLPALTWSFTKSQDSDGDNWPRGETQRINIPIGTNVLELVDLLRDAELWVRCTPGLVLDAFDEYDRDLSGTIVFTAGDNIIEELERERRQSRARSAILVEGENRQGKPRYRAFQKSTYRTELGRRSEGFYRHERTAQRRHLLRVARRRLRSWHREYEGALSLPVLDEVDRVALVDYVPGDTVGLTVPGFYTAQDVRVASVLLHQREAGDYDVTLKLGGFRVG